MQITGSIKEWNAILKSALTLRVKHIFFLSPHTIFLLSPDGNEYAFVESTCFFPKSVSLSEQGYKNIYQYLKSVKKGNLFDDTPYISEMTVTQTALEFTGDLTRRLIMDTELVPVHNAVETKIRDTMTSSFQTESPYFRFSETDLSSFRKIIRENLSEFSHDRKTGTGIRVKGEEGKVVFYFEKKPEEVRVETNITDYLTGTVYMKNGYSFTQKGFYLLDRLSSTTRMEDIILLPQENFSIFEAYMSNMVIKVKTLLKTDTQTRRV